MHVSGCSRNVILRAIVLIIKTSIVDTRFSSKVKGYRASNNGLAVSDYLKSIQCHLDRAFLVYPSKQLPLSLSGTTDTLEREEHLTIPYKAIREGVVNALTHRSYRDTGGSVGIAIYDDRIEITNSGVFPQDMSMERLLGLHDSQPHNPIIANVLYKSTVLESWGRGIKLMVDECRRVGIQDPEFHCDGGFVRVVFHYTRYVAGQVPDKYPTVAPQLRHKWEKCCQQSGSGHFRPKRLWV